VLGECFAGGAEYVMAGAFDEQAVFGAEVVGDLAGKDVGGAGGAAGLTGRAMRAWR
jgi:hypothetical protein